MFGYIHKIGLAFPVRAHFDIDCAPFASKNFLKTFLNMSQNLILYLFPTIYAYYPKMLRIKPLCCKYVLQSNCLIL